MKVYDQSHSHIQELEIREQLGFMDRQNMFYRFEFEDHCVFDDYIDSIPAIKLDTFIFDR